MKTERERTDHRIAGMFPRDPPGYKLEADTGI